MSLVTRCQVCATAFKVQRAQLAARGGKVRCGKCGTIFDGVAGLVEEGAQLLRFEPSPQLGLFDPARRAPRAASPSGGSIALDADDATVPAFLLEEEAPSRRSTLLWALSAVLSAAALFGQAAHRYRTELAVLVPSARTSLDSACRFLNCKVPLPRRPELMSIDSSELQADTRSESLIVLNAMLRNRAPFQQEYPALELTLTDDAEQPVLRRVLSSSDYLDSARAALASRGIPAGAEVMLRVNLDTGRARATGYRLYLFYPQ